MGLKESATTGLSTHHRQIGIKTEQISVLLPKKNKIYVIEKLLWTDEHKSDYLTK